MSHLLDNPEPEPESVTGAILASIRADGYALSTINYLTADGPAVKFTAWVDTGSEVCPPNVEVWTSKGPTRYQAAAAAAQAEAGVGDGLAGVVGRA